jgi:hypothetical protein
MPSAKNPRQLNVEGYLLTQQALETEAADERSELLRLAREKYLEADAISPGVGAYNVACTHSLEGDGEACRTWLQKAKAAKILPDCEQLLGDMDLDAVRGEAWFREFLKELGCESDG